MSLARVATLFGAELRTMARERGALVSLIVLLFLIGTSGPIGAWYVRRAADDESPAKPVPTWDCQPGVMDPVAAAGDVPAWLDWPDPFVDADHAEVLLRFAPDGAMVDVDVVGLDPEAGLDAVQDCLTARARQERRARLDALGIAEAPGALVSYVTLPPEPAWTSTHETPSLRLALAAGATMAMFSVFLQLGPRARASGWMETWLVLPGSRADLVAAWWAVGLVAGAMSCGLVVLGHEAAVAGLGGGAEAVPWALLPVLVAVTSAVGVHSFLDVPDIRTAMVRGAPTILAQMALGALAHLVDARLPGLGSLLPVGGILIAVAGGAAVPWLAVVSAVATTTTLLVDASRALDRLAPRSGPVSLTAARRAAGDYFPEALLLVLIAIAGVGSWAPPEFALRDPILRSAVSFCFFLLLPALLTPTVLRLDRRAVLSFRLPGWRAWAALPFLLAGTVSGGALLGRLATWLFPKTLMWDTFTQSFAGFDSVTGLVFLSVGPGLCEELMFRGAVFGLLRKRFRIPVAILLQAVAFAVLHGMAVRIPHTLGLGLVFGLFVWRTESIFPAMVAHAAHNLTSALLPPDQVDAWAHTPWAWVVTALGLAAAWFAGSGPKRG